MSGRSALVVVVVAGAFASVVLACEEDSTAGPGGGASAGDGGAAADGALGAATPPPPAAAGDFCQKTLGVVVGALAACCTAEDKATQDYRFSHDLAEAFIPVCRSTLEASVAKKRVLYRGDAGDACFAAYAATYAPGACANITQTYADPAGTSCREAFVGVGGEGAPCMGDHECVDGLTCVGYTKDVDGACKAPPAIGEACGAARVDGGSNGAVSLEFGSHPACAAGARCESLERRCVKAAASGERCGFDDECAEPLRCVLGVCGTSGPGGEGAKCLRADDCTPDCFCDGAAGNTQGTCAKKRAAGGSCTGATFVSECIGRCDAKPGEPGKCVSFCGSP
ncbi:MAG: hypothetical protein KF764_20660 [Labilithrix sp.]|nr:hypothetical protein [Labilithrix sp.]